jgi:hypothetical protein
MLDRVTPRELAQRISHKVFETPETAAKKIQDLFHRLDTMLQGLSVSSGDALLAELRADCEWLLPSLDERKEGARELLANVKKCNAKLRHPKHCQNRSYEMFARR